MGQGPWGTHVQNVHALPEAVVDSIELGCQILRHLKREATEVHNPGGKSPTHTTRGHNLSTTQPLTLTRAGSVTVTATRALWRSPSNPTTLVFSSRCRSTLASSTLTCTQGQFTFSPRLCPRPLAALGLPYDGKDTSQKGQDLTPSSSHPSKGPSDRPLGGTEPLKYTHEPD